MKKGIKPYLAQYRIERAVSNNNRNVCFPALNDIKTIGVVISKESDVVDCKQLIESVDVFRFLKFEKLEDSNSQVEDSITNKNLNFLGLPKKEKIQSFVNMDFDVLINLNVVNDKVTDYICAKSRASFKVGMSNRNRIYDLIIDQKESSRLFLMEFVNVLINLNKKNK